ncbi:winged helix DNA-binding protein [Allosphingosinicella vermicomposti]|uniref:winged helix DNA-binding protein n=1 Tax=Allosphingosinicella vermicomposti TaxID=614671 RepID=UPI000D108126|nr:winged helix DNA-binding protein [Allosphingosinicella vermicomposti]
MAGQMTHDDLAMIEYRDDPMLLLLARSEAVNDRSGQMLGSLGCRQTALAGFAAAADRLDEGAAPDVVFLELDGDEGEGLDHLLDRIDQGTRTARFSSIIASPPSLIDVVTARAFHAGVFHLIDPSDEQRRDAVRSLLGGQWASLHDVGKGGPPIKLQQLSEEVGRIATILATLSEHEDDNGLDGAAEDNVSAQQVRNIIRARRLRDQYFGADLFADPAWDMLLDLMAARLEQQRVAVSSLCIAASVPATTALRWIKALTEQGLFVRSADPQDGRRVYIELSETAAAALAAYLRAAQRISSFLA